MAKKKKKTAIVIGSIAAVLVLGMTGIFAYATLTQDDYDHDDDEATNTFTPAKIEIAVQENEDDNSEETPEFENKISWTPDGKNYTAEKQVSITNLDVDGDNNTDAFIRVCLIPRWTISVKTTDGETTADYSGYSTGAFPETISDNSYTITVTDTTKTYTLTFTLASDWESNWIYKNGYFYCISAVEPGESTPLLLESVTITQDFFEAFTENACDFQADVIADSIQTDGGAVEARWEDVEIYTDTDNTQKLQLKTTT